MCRKSCGVICDSPARAHALSKLVRIDLYAAPSNLGNLAPRLSGLLAAERNQDRCFALIQKEVDQVLEELSNGYDTKGNGRI